MKNMQLVSIQQVHVQQLLQQLQNQHILDIHLVDITLARQGLVIKLLMLLEKLQLQIQNGHLILLFMQNGLQTDTLLYLMQMVEHIQVLQQQHGHFITVKIITQQRLVQRHIHLLHQQELDIHFWVMLTVRLQQLPTI